MTPSRAPSPDAPRQRAPHLRTLFLVAALVASVAALGVAPEVLSRQPVVAAEATETTDPPRPAIERVADPTTTTTAPVTTSSPDPVPEPQPVRIVTDPRPGDHRVDPEADTLPAGFGPTEPTGVLRDLAYGPDTAHRYDLYLPDGDNAPLVVFLHSGGWIAGTNEWVPDIVLRFLDHGYAIASVEYRLAPATVFPGPVEDVKRAVREIKAMGATTGRIDPDRIVLFGTSAGGHLAVFAGATVGSFEPEDLSAAATGFDSSVDGIVSVVGPTDLVQLYTHPNAWAAPMSGTFMGCFPACAADRLRPANPAEYLDGDLPPAYWAYGALDPLVDLDTQGIAIAEAWATAGGESWLDVVDDGGHNLDETVVNMRQLEAFVATALAAG